MITNADLAGLTVRRVIFHDVPNSPKNNPGTPVFAEAETEIDPGRRAHLRKKLTQALGSHAAYPIEFMPVTGSPVPASVQDFTAKTHTPDQFVKMSRALAQHLFELQGGAVSPGLLAVMDVVTLSRAGLVLMKLEREAGAQLELEIKDGKKAFAMSVLDNLVLTDGTRLFKAAMFVRLPNDGEFAATACDSQRSIATSDDVAHFWLRFLGCHVSLNPRVTTSRFFESTLRYINQSMTDPVEMNDLYEHLQSQMKSQGRVFSPKKFIEDYVPPAHRLMFTNHLKDESVPLVQFTKDLADITANLRRTALRTSKGVLISVPVDESQVVEVAKHKITIHDSVSSVGRRGRKRKKE